MTRSAAALQGSGEQDWSEAGSGEPVLLVHGIGGTSRTWLPLIDALATERRVIAWSLPGYDTAPPLADDSPSAQSYAARALEVLDRLSIPSAHVVGHSLGAVIAAEMARDAPDRVVRLSLVCPVTGMGRLAESERARVHDARASEIRQGGMKAFAEARTASIVGPKVAKDDLDDIVATMAAIPETAYLQAWAMMCRSDIHALLEGCTTPALVVGGEVDPVAPPDAVAEIARTLGVRAHTLRSVGHFPTHEATGDLLALLGAR